MKDAYSDVGVLVVPGKIQHVIQSQHAWRDLGEIHSWVDVVLRKTARRRWDTSVFWFFTANLMMALNLR